MEIKDPTYSRINRIRRVFRPCWWISCKYRCVFQKSTLTLIHQNPLNACHLQLEDVPGWPTESCLKCEKFLQDIRSFREEIYQSQATLSGFILQSPTDPQEDPEGHTDVKVEDQTVEINILPESYFEDSDHDNTQDEEEPISDPEEVVPKKRIKKEKSPRTRVQPNRQNKREPNVEKRHKYSRYTLAQERKLEQYMKDMGLFTCHLCSEELDNGPEFVLHFRKMHKRTTAYVFCCNGKRNMGTMACEHMEFHLNQEVFKCHICHIVVKARNTLRLHMANVHAEGSVQRFVCDQCGKVCPTLGKLNDHKKTHTRSCKCSYCGKGEWVVLFFILLLFFVS